MPTIQGQWQSQGSTPSIGIIVSRFNQNVSEALLQGALDTLTRVGIPRDLVDVLWVPGAFEIPGTARRVLPRYDALITLGAVIRGETAHFDFVAGAVSGGVAELARLGEKPVIFGVLTCNTVEEATSRAGGKNGNRGSDCAIAAIEMISLYRQLSEA